MFPTDEQIYYYLFGDIIINQLYISPLKNRRKKADTIPSFNIHDHMNDGIIRWKDFGLPEDSVSGNKAINLLMEIKDLTYYEARVYAERNILPGIKDQIIVLERNPTFKAIPYARYTHDFSYYELSYWESYGVNKQDLVREEIYSLESLRWGNNPISLRSTDSIPVFLYLFGLNPISWKIYVPGDETRKKDFKTWNISGVIEGLHSFNPSKPCGVLSSTKDRTVFKKALPEWTAVNSTSENVIYSLVECEELLKSPYRLIMYDSDEPGYNAAKSLYKKTNWPFIDMRNKLDGEKDLADYSLKYGIPALRQKLMTLL